MKQIIKNNLPFLLPTILLWVIMLVGMLLYSKADLHLMLNAYHTKGLNFFFRFYTEVGGWVPFVVVAGLLFYKSGAAILVLASQLLAIIPIQLLKRIIDEDRPKLFFEKLQVTLPQVEGVDMHSYHSFPSGHTAAAFALFLCLSFIVNKPIYKLLFFVLATGVAFSRIYLSQHFAGDVLAGSILGVIVAFTGYYFYQRINASWFDKSLLKIKN